MILYGRLPKFLQRSLPSDNRFSDNFELLDSPDSEVIFYNDPIFRADTIGNNII